MLQIIIHYVLNPIYEYCEIGIYLAGRKWYPKPKISFHLKVIASIILEYANPYPLNLVSK